MAICLATSVKSLSTYQVNKLSARLLSYVSFSFSNSKQLSLKYACIRSSVARIKPLIGSYDRNDAMFPPSATARPRIKGGKARAFLHTNNALEELWSRRQSSQGGPSFCTLRGPSSAWSPNEGTRCIIFVSGWTCVRARSPFNSKTSRRTSTSPSPST